MESLLATVVAIFAVGLFVAALVLLTAGELAVAGVCFLSASLVIYLRETRVLDG